MQFQGLRQQSAFLTQLYNQIYSVQTGVNNLVQTIEGVQQQLPQAQLDWLANGQATIAETAIADTLTYLTQIKSLVNSDVNKFVLDDTFLTYFQQIISDDLRLFMEQLQTKYGNDINQVWSITDIQQYITQALITFTEEVQARVGNNANNIALVSEILDSTTKAFVQQVYLKYGGDLTKVWTADDVQGYITPQFIAFLETIQARIASDANNIALTSEILDPTTKSLVDAMYTKYGGDINQVVTLNQVNTALPANVQTMINALGARVGYDQLQIAVLADILSSTVKTFAESLYTVYGGDIGEVLLKSQYNTDLPPVARVMLTDLATRISNDQTAIALLTDITNHLSINDRDFVIAANTFLAGDPTTIATQAYVLNHVTPNMKFFLQQLGDRATYDQTKIAFLTDIPSFETYLPLATKNMLVALDTRIGNDQSQIALLSDIPGTGGGTLTAAGLFKLNSLLGTLATIKLSIWSNGIQMPIDTLGDGMLDMQGTLDRDFVVNKQFYKGIIDAGGYTESNISSVIRTSFTNNRGQTGWAGTAIFKLPYMAAIENYIRTDADLNALFNLGAGTIDDVLELTFRMDADMTWGVSSAATPFLMQSVIDVWQGNGFGYGPFVPYSPPPSGSTTVLDQHKLINRFIYDGFTTTKRQLSSNISYECPYGIAPLTNVGPDGHTGFRIGIRFNVRSGEFGANNILDHAGYAYNFTAYIGLKLKDGYYLPA